MKGCLCFSSAVHAGLMSAMRPGRREKNRVLHFELEVSRASNAGCGSSIRFGSTVDPS